MSVGLGARSNSARSRDKDAIVYTDDALAYDGVARWHATVRHSVGEYVRDMAHTNGVESFWSTLKRAHKGTFHRLSPKHLNRYIQGFAGKHNLRESGTLDQMRDTVAQLLGRRLLLRDLIADSGLVPWRGRSRARASASGVVPLRSRFGSSMGFIAIPSHHWSSPVVPVNAQQARIEVFLWVPGHVGGGMNAVLMGAW